MTSRFVIGLTSGSSFDGVDAALVELEGVGLELRARLVQSLHQPYGKELREGLLRVSGPGPIETRLVAQLHRITGEALAAAARQVADQASFSLARIQCLGCSGQTIWHDGEGRFPTTLGLGVPALLAERTGVTTVSDFRSRDLAVGGQGAPLAALADALLFRHPTETRVLVHLGGLARIVYLPGGKRSHEALGFEAGPCNVLLDALMRQLTGGREAFDPGGRHAVQGRCIDPLLERWLNHPYLQRRPPKSLPRPAFGEGFAHLAVSQARQLHWGLHDLLCTATHFVAQGVARAIQRFLPTHPPIDRILLSGGGTRNGLLLHLLEQNLPNIVLERTDKVGIPADARKSMAFALLGALTLDGVPANLPGATGATASRLLGSITPGAPANWARCLAWMAGQVSPMAQAA